MNDVPVRSSVSRIPPECERARVRASAWIDGELADESSLRAHLARCDDCRAHVAELREVPALLAPLRHAGPEVDLWPRIHARALASSAPAIPVWSARFTRFAALVVGFAATAALQRTITGRSEDRTTAADTAVWGAALHAELPELRHLETSPENQLLAALPASREVVR